MPDLSSSPNPSLTIRSYCFSCGDGQREVQALGLGQLERDARILGGVRGREKARVLAVLHVLAVSPQHGRIGARLGEHLPQRRQVQAEGGAQTQSFRQGGGVAVHDHVDQRLHFGGFARRAEVTE